MKGVKVMKAEDPLNRDTTVIHGVAEAVAPGVRRVVARNPSPMTFTGTASYLIGRAEIAIVDPGPEDDAHRDALLKAIGAVPVVAILVTHSHRDHSPGARALARATGAPVLAFGPHGAGMGAQSRALIASGADLGGGEGADRSFAPDRHLVDGEAVMVDGRAVRALHTPGHLSNHLSFWLADDRVAFTGDAAMGWSSTLVSPPEGDMADCMASLRRLRALDAALLLPGHGHAVKDPATLLEWQIAHREAREAQILAALADGPADAGALAARLYADIDPRLLPAAARNVLAHLLALAAQGRARHAEPLTAQATFALS
jgi:glyoxylase-like metal-dependent hydrolase (beta-lactamase superfamily II)